MTRTKLRATLAEQTAQFINAAAGLAEERACRVCQEAADYVVGHAECLKFVTLAREIRKLGEKGTP